MRPLLRTLPPRPLLLATQRPLFSATNPRRQQDNNNHDGKEAFGSIPTGVKAQQVYRKRIKPSFLFTRFSVGTDICHVPRIQKVVEERGMARFASRILAEDEVEDAVGRGYLLRRRDEGGVQGGQGGQVGGEQVGGEQGEQGEKIVGEQQVGGLSKEVVFLAGR